MTQDNYGFSAARDRLLAALGGDQEKLRVSWDDLTTAARALLTNGYFVVPVHSVFSDHPARGKAPKGEGWQTRTDSSVYLQQLLYPGDNLGIRCGEPAGQDASGRPLYVVGIDVDFELETEAAAVRATLKGVLTRYGRRPKFLALVRTLSAQSRDIKWRHSDGREMTTQIIGAGGHPTAGPKQFVCFGYHPGTMQLYAWEGSSPFEIPADQLPSVELEDVFAEFDRVLAPLGWSRKISVSTTVGVLPQDAFGVVTEDEKRKLAAQGRVWLEHEIKKLRLMPEKSGRGRVAYEIGRRIGPIIACGAITIAEAENALYAAQPKEDIGRDFERGLGATVDPAQHPACRALKQIRGYPVVAVGGHILPVPKKPVYANAPAEITRPDGRSARQIATEAWEAKRVPRNILLSTDRATASTWGSAFAQANDGLIFRSTAGGRVVKVSLAACPPLPKNLDMGGFNSDLLTTNEILLETEVDKATLSLLMNESATFWRPVEYPDGQVPADVEEVEWTEKQGFATVTVKGKTMRWAEWNAFNPEILGDYDPQRIVWRSAPAPKGNIALAAMSFIRGGEHDAWLRRLSGVSAAPCLAPDGSIWAADGYNCETRPDGIGVFVALGKLRGHVVIPSDDLLSNPNSNEVREAIHVLRQFIGLFPYADNVSEAVLLSLFLSLIARPSLTLVPQHIVDAPSYGTGKSFSALMLATAAGASSHVIACAGGGDRKGDSDVEIAKRFETELLKGANGLILLDDVPYGRIPNFPTLRSYLTIPKPINIRPLGESNSLAVDPTRAVIVATGNNVTVSQDMVRRSVHCYLDREPAVARGWNKEDAEQKLKRVMAEPALRGKFLSAALALLRANLLARPYKHANPTENYEIWSDRIRETCIMVTGADPIRSQEALRTNDPAAEEYRQIAEALLELTGGQWFTTKEIDELVSVAALMTARSAASNGQNSDRPVNIEIIRQHFDAESQKGEPLTKRLGHYLKKYKNHPTNGTPCRRVRHLPPETKNRNAVARWRIE